MQIGQKIKQARLEAGLSQRQLCGQRLTRNMLSLIENGSARPSMDTLRYFAKALGKPVGWFLEEETRSSNQLAVEQARACWQRGDGAGALQALEAYKAPDEQWDAEQGLVSYLSHLTLAQQALEEGRTPYACHLLEQAEKLKSPYITHQVRQNGQLLLARAGRPAALNCDAVLLAQAQCELPSDPQRSRELLQAAQDKNAAQWLWLAGQAEYALQNFSAAVGYLTPVEAVYPEAVSLLEVCYRELGDFKKAYEYACKGR